MSTKPQRSGQADTKLRRTGKADTAVAAEFGERLRAARRRLGMTLKDVSDRSGSSIAYLSDLERGLLKNPTLETLTGLAAALNVSINDLLGVGNRDNSDYLPPALDRFSAMPQFLDEMKREAKRRKLSEEELRRSWLKCLVSIEVLGDRPRTELDYLFIWDAIRRALG